MHITSVADFLPNGDNHRGLGGIGNAPTVVRQGVADPVDKAEVDTLRDDIVMDDAKRRTFRWTEDGLTDDDADGEDDPDYQAPSINRDAPVGVSMPVSFRHT
jgi:hypothetical protein